MDVGGIPTNGFHVPNEHMMTRGKNRDRREVDPTNTTGKSICMLAVIVKSVATPKLKRMQCSYRCVVAQNGRAPPEGGVEH